MLVTRATKQQLVDAAKAARVAFLNFHAAQSGYRFTLIPVKETLAERFQRLAAMPGGLRPTPEQLKTRRARSGLENVWQRFSASPFVTKKTGQRRRVHAVCWHGHRAFMRELYKLVPNARIETAFATYRNAEHFEATHEATASKQVGSVMAPVAFAELGEHGYGRAAGSFPAAWDKAMTTARANVAALSDAEIDAAVAATEARRGETWNP